MKTDLKEELARQIGGLKLHVNKQALLTILSQKLKAIEANLPNEESEAKEDSRLIEKINALTTEVSSLKQLLSLKAEPSIDYAKIPNLPTQKQLIVDNLSMEQAALNLENTDTVRFFNFCTAATYQIENLLNYFYWKRHHGVAGLVAALQAMGTTFPKSIPTKISEVETHSKILAFETEFYYPFGHRNPKLQLIRKVRNLDSHRCSVLVENYDEHFAKYHELLEKIYRTNEQARAKNLSIKYEKTPQDKRVETQGELAEFLKNIDYNIVREEVTILYEKVAAAEA